LIKNSDLEDFSIRSTIVKSKKIALIVTSDLTKGDWGAMDKWQALQKYFEMKKNPICFVDGIFRTGDSILQ
jgi:hypothetical protein